MAEYFLVWDPDVGVFDIYVSHDAPEKTMHSRSVGAADEAIEQYKGRIRKEFGVEARPQAMSFDSLEKAMDYHEKLMRENPYKPKYEAKSAKGKYEKRGGK